jgi:hypothetical protein
MLNKEQYFLKKKEILCIYNMMDTYEYEIYTPLKNGSTGAYLEIDKITGDMILSSNIL